MIDHGSVLMRLQWLFHWQSDFLDQAGVLLVGRPADLLLAVMVVSPLIEGLDEGMRRRCTNGEVRSQVMYHVDIEIL